jgi:Protocatechuate 3,4-dioxygenase beta subunit
MPASAIADTCLPMTPGAYRFRTILPALYPGRTRHYHVKVQAPQQPVLTTQLYFPDEPGNSRDGLFRRELVMRVAEAGDGLSAQFAFVLDVRLGGRRAESVGETVVKTQHPT